MRIEVFISYAREDIDQAQQIVTALEQEGLIVWWDEKLMLSSGNFPHVIDEAIKTAQCVIVLWSEHCKESKWVPAEAHMADELHKLINVRLGDAQPPLPFNVGQCTPLQLKNGDIAEDNLKTLTIKVKEMIGIQGPNEHIIRPRAPGEPWTLGDLAIDGPVPGTERFISFRPCGNSGVFLLMRFDTTAGWVNHRIPSAMERHDKCFDEDKTEYVDEESNRYLKVTNEIYFINDPIRPFSIQIGGLRSVRPSATPGTISGDITVDQLSVLPINKDWMSMTLAEIISNKESLQYLLDKTSRQDDLDLATKKTIRTLVGKNPNAPKKIQEETCTFCDKTFKEYRHLSNIDKEQQYSAYIIANDYPFGPFFHYLAITEDAVHSWEELTYKQIRGLNLIIYEFLSDASNRKGAAGIEFGFNSTVRHLVLGSQTRSSAGASIPHIHKQVWGMAPRTSNLAEQLIEISQAYWNQRIDFQKSYLAALQESDYVIWNDGNVVLYVPYGQCSMYELQAMVCEPCNNFTELSQQQVESLSKAEYIALRLFKALDINSFNNVVLSKLYHDTRAPTFRLVEAFITREVDLAVSELSMLYVVDQHPWTSRNKLMSAWEEIQPDILGEISFPSS